MEADREKKTLMQELLLAKAEAEGLRETVRRHEEGKAEVEAERKKEQGGGQRYAVGGGDGDCHECADHGDVPMPVLWRRLRILARR